MGFSKISLQTYREVLKENEKRAITHQTIHIYYKTTSMLDLDLQYDVNFFHKSIKILTISIVRNVYNNNNAFDIYESTGSIFCTANLNTSTHKGMLVSVC